MKSLLLLWSFLIAGVVGWVMNIMTIFQTVDVPVTGVFILRIIGIFVAPLGAILGYF